MDPAEERQGGGGQKSSKGGEKGGRGSKADLVCVKGGVVEGVDSQMAAPDHGIVVRPLLLVHQALRERRSYCEQQCVSRGGCPLALHYYPMPSQ